MKVKLFFLLAGLFTLPQAFAQVSKTHDFDDYSLTRLFTYPGDEHKLLGVKRETNFEAEHVFSYFLEEMGAGYSSAIPLNGVQQIVREPVIFDGKLVFSAVKYNGDYELFVFDGSALIMVDINPGSEGSAPEYELVNDRLFVIGKRGDFRQLFELDENMVLKQLSFEEAYNAKQFITTTAEHTFYLTEADSAYQSRIRKCRLTDSLTLEVATIRGSYVYDRMEFNGDFFFNTNLVAEDIWISLHYEVNRLFRLDPEENLQTVLYDSTGLNLYSRNRSFILGDRMYMHARALSLAHQDTVEVLYSSSDGLSFEPVVSLEPHHWFFEFLVQDGKCTIVTEDSWTEHHTLNRFDGENMLAVYESNYHLHYVSENDDELFLIAVQHDSTMYHLLKVNFNDHQAQLFQVTDYGSHPPYFSKPEKGAEWMDGKLYFICGHADPLDYYSMDIFSYDPDFVSISELQTGTGVILAPNPVAGDHFSLTISEKADFRIFSMDGKLIRKGELVPGQNTIRDFNVDSGAYIIRVGGQAISLLKN